MAGHPIESLMRTTMESLKSMVDVNTVVGEPVETKDGTVIMPVSRVSLDSWQGAATRLSCREEGWKTARG